MTKDVASCVCNHSQNWVHWIIRAEFATRSLRQSANKRGSQDLTSPQGKGLLHCRGLSLSGSRLNPSCWGDQKFGDRLVVEVGDQVLSEKRVAPCSCQCFLNVSAVSAFGARQGDQGSREFHFRIGAAQADCFSHQA